VSVQAQFCADYRLGLPLSLLYRSNRERTAKRADFAAVMSIKHRPIRLLEPTQRGYSRLRNVAFGFMIANNVVYVASEKVDTKIMAIGFN